MILLAAGLLAFAVTDLVRWHPTKVSPWRGLGAIVVGTGSVTALAALSDSPFCSPLLASGVTAVGLMVWVGLDYVEIKPGWGIAYVLVVLLALGWREILLPPRS